MIKRDIYEINQLVLNFCRQNSTLIRQKFDSLYQPFYVSLRITNAKSKFPISVTIVTRIYIIVVEFTLFNINLEAGIRYYSTVTACNTANLCTSVTSDGVVIDNSPPVPGIVQDGVDELDAEYQSTR